MAASDSRKATGPMRSSGEPILPWGMREVHFCLRSGLSSRIFLVLSWGIAVSVLLHIYSKIDLTNCPWGRRADEGIDEITYRAVSMYPGEMQLTRMPR